MITPARSFRPAVLAPATAFVLAGLLVTGCSSDDDGDAADDAAADDAADDAAADDAAADDAASDDAAADDAADDAGTDDAAADDGADTAGAAVEIISVADAFDPVTLEVAAGTEITWTNADGAPHTTTAEDGSWDSGDIAGGATFAYTPTAPGTYTYFCSIHPSMTGEIVVG